MIWKVWNLSWTRRKAKVCKHYRGRKRGLWTVLSRRAGKRGPGEGAEIETEDLQT